MTELCIQAYSEGTYSPRLLKQDELGPETIVLSENEDFRRLEGEHGGDLAPQEIHVEKHYLWSDKYRPRKPRYFNRVHTGYDWNQYNKKHYDSDNPPPKTVQGYKFNVSMRVSCFFGPFN